MTQYNAVAEVDVRPTPKRAEAWLTALADYSPAVGLAERGTTEVIVTLDAEYLEVAVAHALTALRAALGDLLSLTVMPTAEWDARTESVQREVDLIGTREAAQLLGVSRQRLQQLVVDGTLSFHMIGNSFAFRRDLIERMAARKRGGPVDARGAESPGLDPSYGVQAAIYPGANRKAR